VVNRFEDLPESALAGLLQQLEPVVEVVVLQEAVVAPVVVVAAPVAPLLLVRPQPDPVHLRKLLYLPHLVSQQLFAKQAQRVQAAYRQHQLPPPGLHLRRFLPGPPENRQLAGLDEVHLCGVGFGDILTDATAGLRVEAGPAGSALRQAGLFCKGVLVLAEEGIELFLAFPYHRYILISLPLRTANEEIIR
jgi:hypothetical protein